MSGTCPASPAMVHASCELRVTFPAVTCARVRIEAEARITAGPAFDPHNHGNYSLLSSDSMLLVGQRITGSACAGCYTDQFQLTFEDTPPGCIVSACSTSQGGSFYDYSTNYCNLHVLWCNAQSGCPSIGEPDFAYTEEVVACSAGGTQQHDAAACNPDAAQPTLSSPPPSEAPLIDAVSRDGGSDALPPPPADSSSLGVGGAREGARFTTTVIVVIVAVAMAITVVVGYFGLQRYRAMRIAQSAADRRRRATTELGLSSTSATRTSDELAEDEPDNDEWDLNDAAKEAQGVELTVEAK